jgi:hypothetical protein
MYSPLKSFLDGQLYASSGGGVPYGTTDSSFFAGAALKHDEMQRDAKRRAELNSPTSYSYSGGASQKANSGDESSFGAWVALFIILSIGVAIAGGGQSGTHAGNRYVAPQYSGPAVPSYQNPASVDVPPRYGSVNVDNLRLRMCAGSNCQVIAKMRRGAQVEFLGDAGDNWVRVAWFCSDTSAINGYAYRPMISF